MFYWGTHTRFAVSVVIDLSLTKIRRTRSANCICMEKRARIYIIVLYGKLYITRIRASYTWQYVKRSILLRSYGISHACANSGAQAVFSLPRKKRPGNDGSCAGRRGAKYDNHWSSSQNIKTLLYQFMFILCMHQQYNISQVHVDYVQELYNSKCTT